MNDNEFIIKLNKFYQGFSPLAFNNSLTEVGGSGHASVMVNVDVVNGDYVTQGPALSNLTNGTQAGAVTELINFIMDKAVTSDVTYGIGASKLFKISSTTVTSDATWPQAITSCTDGQSVQVLKGNLYYFFNKSSGGDIGKYNLDATFDHDWGSTTPTGFAALQKAPHPSDKKEDILLFGNGRYVGTYIVETNTLAPTKLDFGNDAEVADVLYNAANWYIAVNSGVTGTNRTEGQIYLYDGSAIPTTLADETGVGMQRIGFLYRLNGIIYVAYQDLSSTAGFIIGYIMGTQIKAIGRFTGTLPNFQQKTLYKNTILFLSSGLVYSAGALIDDLPFQLSQLANGGYSTVGAIACPFGVPLVASGSTATFTAATTDIITSNAHGLSDGEIVRVSNSGGALPTGLSAATDYYVISADTNTFKVSTSAGGSAVDITGVGTGTHTWYGYRLAKFSGYDVTCSWKSIVIPVSQVAHLSGVIDHVTIFTKALGSAAKCSLTIKANQNTDTSNTMDIETTSKKKHVFSNMGLGTVEDFQIVLDWSGGSATNDCAIRTIIVQGHFTET